MNLRSPAGLGALAAAAVGSALWVEHSARAAERRHPTLDHVIHVHGTRLHYRIVGEGPPVLLLHGNLVHGADWDASGLVERLARQHQVVVIDRPGFGASDRPRGCVWTPAQQAHVLRHALWMLGIQRPVVVGHSLGTQVALCMALQDPARVAGLVLVSGYYWPSLRLDRWIAALAAAPLVGDVLRYTTGAWTARATLPAQVRAMFHPLPVPEAFFRELPSELLLRPLQQRATAEDGSRMVTQARVLRDRYADLQVPVTVVAGTRDKVVSPQQSVRFQQLAGRGRLHLVDGVGHMAHYEAHEQIVAGIDHAFGSGTGTPASAGHASTAVPAAAPADPDTVNAALTTPPPLLEV